MHVHCRNLVCFIILPFFLSPLWHTNVTVCNCSENRSVRNGYDSLKCCLSLASLSVFVSVCVYQTINVLSLTSDAHCCGMLPSCQAERCTHTHRPVSHVHTHPDSVCGSGTGDTCVTVKRQDICLGNLDVSGCTHVHIYTQTQ